MLNDNGDTNDLIKMVDKKVIKELDDDSLSSYEMELFNNNELMKQSFVED